MPNILGMQQLIIVCSPLIIAGHAQRARPVPGERDQRGVLPGDPLARAQQGLRILPVQGEFNILNFVQGDNSGLMQVFSDLKYELCFSIS